MQVEFVHAENEKPVPFPPATHQKSGAKIPDLGRVRDLIVSSTNDFRKDQKLTKVTVSPELSETARYFADFMATNDKYGHDADGSDAGKRARDHKYVYCLIEENIALEYDSRGFNATNLARSFFVGWKNSPGHRKNMLNADVLETGVAVAHSPRSDRFYAVQLFGRPRSATIQFAIRNESSKKVAYKIDGKQFPLERATTVRHQQCQTSELVFLLPDGVGKDPRESQAYVPRTGSDFVLRDDGAGGVTVDVR